MTPFMVPLSVLVALLAVPFIFKQRLSGSAVAWFELKLRVKHALAPIVKALSSGTAATPDSEGGAAHALTFYVLLDTLLLTVLMATAATAYTTGLAVAILVAHVLSFICALLVIDEENDVWNGLLSRSETSFRSAKFVKNATVLLSSALFIVLLVALAALLWDDAGYPRLVTTAACDTRVCSYLQYVTLVIYEVPLLGWLLRHASAIAGPAFTEWPGTQFQFAINFIAVTLIYGVFKVLYTQRKAIDDLIVAFGRAKEQKIIDYLRLRAEHAPEYILGKLLERAIRDPDPQTRRKFIDVVTNARVYVFPHTFLRYLQREDDNTNKVRGLNAIRRMVTTCGNEFEPGIIDKALAALKQQTEDSSIRHKARVQDGLDELIIAYVSLIKDRGWRHPANAKMPNDRLFELATHGPDHIRDRARALASTLQQMNYIEWLLGDIRGAAKDTARRGRIAAALETTWPVVKDEASRFKASRRRHVLDRVRARSDELVSQRGKLDGAQRPSGLRQLTEREFRDYTLMQDLLIRELDRLSRALSKSLPAGQPVSPPAPTEKPTAAAAEPAPVPLAVMPEAQAA